jgi:hypothetical protein
MANGPAWMTPVALHVAGNEWRLSITNVVRAGDLVLLQLTLAGPSVCTVVLCAREIVRGETARQILETVCEWLERRRSSEDQAVLELPARVA